MCQKTPLTIYMFSFHLHNNSIKYYPTLQVRKHEKLKVTNPEPHLMQSSVTQSMFRFCDVLFCCLKKVVYTTILEGGEKLCYSNSKMLQPQPHFPSNYLYKM